MQSEAGHMCPVTQVRGAIGVRMWDDVTKAITHSLSSISKKESCAKDASIQIVLITGACAATPI